MNKIAIIGGGGHARVLSEIIRQSDDMLLVGCFDDATERGTVLWEDVRALGPLDSIGTTADKIDAFVSGIGNNLLRRKISNENPEINWVSLVHPKAIVSPSAKIGHGSVILAGAVVGTNAVIGNQVIVNANAVVDHDCQIGDFVHLSIGSLTGSNSIVEEICLVQIGQVVPSFSKIKA